MKHLSTKDNVIKIESIVNSIKSKWDSANADIARWRENKEYSIAVINKRIFEIKNEAELYASEQGSKLHKFVAEILEGENKLIACSVDLKDTEIVNAAQLISSIGTAMPMTVRKEIFNSFRGNYPAERVILQLFDTYELDFERPTTIEKLVGDLDTEIRGFNSQSKKTPIQYRRIEKALNIICHRVNIDYQVDFGVSDSVFLEALSSAAGVPIEW